MEHRIIQTIKEMLTERNIPHFLQNDIIYKHKGMAHPMAEVMTNYWEYMRDCQDAFTKMDLYTESYTDEDTDDEDLPVIKYRIKHTIEESDYPVLHFPILFNRANI